MVWPEFPMPPIDLPVFQGALSWKPCILSPHSSRFMMPSLVSGCLFLPSERLYAFKIYSYLRWFQLSYSGKGYVSVIALELVYDISIFGLIILKLLKGMSFKTLKEQGGIMHIIVRDGILYFLWAMSYSSPQWTSWRHSKVSSFPRCVCGHLWQLSHRWVWLFHLWLPIIFK